MPGHSLGLHYRYIPLFVGQNVPCILVFKLKNYFRWQEYMKNILISMGVYKVRSQNLPTFSQSKNYFFSNILTLLIYTLSQLSCVLIY